MRRLRTDRLGFARVALVALVLFAAGAAAHFAHHLAEPECDDGGPASHPCVSCSVLHGAALAEEAVAAVPSAPAPSIELHWAEATAPVVIEPGPGGPRAPPQA